MDYFNLKLSPDIYDELILERLREERGVALSKSEWDKELSRRSEKEEQVGRIRPDERTGAECVQSFISNMTAPMSLKEMLYRNGESLPENLLSYPENEKEKENEWTVPQWAKAGDIVFFMHAKTARTILTRLRSELRESDSVSPSEREQLQKMIDNNLNVHKQYGGKIFAIGRVCGGPESITSDELADTVLHWKSRNYAAIDHIVELENPVDISDFKRVTDVSRESAITPLYDEVFMKLRELIAQTNALPFYATECIARPIPLRNINSENWYVVANDYRRSFITEQQFRKFYLDYLLSAVGDQKRFFIECRCQRDDIADSFMDYVIKIDGKYLPVEAKLSVDAAPHIKAQAAKYVINSNIVLDSKKNRTISGADCYPGKVLVADTFNLYMYTASDNSLRPIFSLNDLKTADDLLKIRRIICQSL